MGGLRTRLPGVPFGACTATASPEKLKKIREGLAISDLAISILEPTNRPNLYYGVRVIEGSGFGEQDLDFLIPNLNVDDQDFTQILKTIIYVDQKPLAPKVANALRVLLPKSTRVRPKRPTVWDGDLRSVAEKVVSIYHSDVSKTMKGLVTQDWRSGQSRIMVATSAWGMGIDDVGIERIIQWGAKRLDNLDTLIQRFGRCARNPETQGVCVLFTEKSLVGPHSDRCQRDDRRRGNGEETRAAMVDGVYKFINTPGDIKCRRKVILGYFGDCEYHQNNLSLGPCCDHCNHNSEVSRLAPILQPLFRIPPQSKPHFPHASPALQVYVKSAMKQLRTVLRLRDYSNDDTITDGYIISEEPLGKIATSCRGITEKQSLLHVPGLTFDREFWDSYAEEVAIRIQEVVSNYQEPFINNMNNQGLTESSTQMNTTYDKMTINQLKPLLKTRGLPVSGTKMVLIERLVNYDSLYTAESPTHIGQVSESTPTLPQRRVLAEITGNVNHTISGTPKRACITRV